MTSIQKKISLPQSKIILNSSQFHLFTLIVVYGYFINDQVIPFYGLFIIYGLLPLFDQFFTCDWRNPTAQEADILIKQNYKFQFAVVLAMLVDWATFFKFMKIVSTTQINDLATLYYILGILIMTCHIGAVGFTFTHQIFHKQALPNRILGTLGMCKTFQMHFTIEHLYGHHKNVATPIDPASAQRGITLYQFVPKSVIGSWFSAYKIEKQKNKSFLMNGAVISIISSILFTIVIYFVYDIKGLIYFLIYAFICIFFLETINYIEHYGLQRQQLQNGQYEKVNIRHSWNAPYRFTNYFLFKLQRHSDHHQNCLKPYQILQSLECSPQLPHGYSVMVMIAFFPKMWFAIMDPLVQEYQKNKNVNLLQSEAFKNSQKLTMTCIKRGFTVTFIMVVLRIISSTN